MKQLLFLVFLSSVGFAQDTDSTVYDSTYRLYEFQRQKMVDTSAELILVEEPMEWIGTPTSINDYAIGSNYGSTQNVNPVVATFVSVAFLLFVLYVIFRVRKSLKSDESKKNRKSKE